MTIRKCLPLTAAVFIAAQIPPFAQAQLVSDCEEFATLNALNGGVYKCGDGTPQDDTNNGPHITLTDDDVIEDGRAGGAIVLGSDGDDPTRSVTNEATLTDAINGNPDDVASFGVGASGAAQATVTNNADITLLGAGTHGLVFEDSGGTINNTANITAGIGIAVQYSGLSVEINNEGSVTGLDDGTTDPNHGVWVSDSIDFGFESLNLGSGSDASPRLTINNAEGATMEGQGTNANGVRVDLSGSAVIGETVLNNAGTIGSANHHGIFLADSTAVTIDNSGTISSGGGGVATFDAVMILGRAMETVSITNSGTISSAKGRGIGSALGDANPFTSFTLDNSGVIEGAGGGATNTNAAVFLHRSTSATVTNSGTIRGVGIEGDTYNPSGDGLRVWAEASAMLTNTGTISSADASGVHIEQRGTDDILESAVTNDGEISGATGIHFRDGSTVTLNNSGTIVGVGGSGIGSSLRNGSPFTSFAIDNSGAVTGTAATAVQIADTTTVEITNSGTISSVGIAATETESAQLSGDGLNILARETMTLNNTGSLLSADAVGVTIDDSSAGGDTLQTTIGNEGTIGGATGGLRVVDGNSAAVTNQGTIRSDSDFALNASSGTVTLTNTGEIATTEAVGFDSGSAVLGALLAGDSISLDNGAGGTLGFTRANLAEQPAPAEGEEPGTDPQLVVDNAGQIANLELLSVSAADPARAEVTNSGTIDSMAVVDGATQHSGFSDFALSVDNFESAVITNSGTIRQAGRRVGDVFSGGDGLRAADNDAANGGSLTLNNSGTVAGSDHGVRLRELPQVSVTNSGTIAGLGNDLGEIGSGAAGIGLSAANNADAETPVTPAGSSISVDNSGTLSGVGDALAAAYFETVQIANTGTLSSGQGNAVDIVSDGTTATAATLTNSGVIEATEAAAVTADAGTALSIDNQGGTVRGDLLAGAGTGDALNSAGGTFDRAAGSETLTIAGFESVTVGGGDVFLADTVFANGANAFDVQHAGLASYHGTVRASGPYTVQAAGTLQLVIGEDTPFYLLGGTPTGSALFHAESVNFGAGATLAGALTINSLDFDSLDQRRVYEALGSDTGINGDPAVTATTGPLIAHETIVREGGNRLDIALRVLNAGEVLSQAGARDSEADALAVLQGLLYADTFGEGDPLRESFANAELAGADGLRTLAESLLPDLAGQVWRSNQHLNNLLNRQIEQRLQGRRGGSAGSDFVENGLWLQGFASDFEQDRTSRAAGFDGDSSGFSLGFDGTLRGGHVVGGAVTASSSDIDSEVAGNNIENDGQTATAYGNARLLRQMDLAWRASYGKFENDSRRRVAGTTAEATYDSRQFSARVELSRDYRVNQRHFLRPSASLAYDQLLVDGYRESGSSAALHVRAQRLQEALLGAGAEYVFAHETRGGATLLPSLGLHLEYALNSDEIQSTNRFVAGGPAFRTAGHEPEELRYVVNAGLKYLAGERTTIDFDIQHYSDTDFDANSIALKIRWDF